jgi:protein TonB
MGRWSLIIGSLLGHGGLLLWLDHIEAKVHTETTAIEMFEAAQKEPPKPPPPAEVVPEPEPQVARAKAAPAPAEAEPPPTDAAPALDALPDFGLELGGVSGGGGFAVAQGTGPRSAPQTRPLKKELSPPSDNPKPALADPCQEAPAKPKLLHLPQPGYTEAARAAGIEGKVRISITVDQTGQVTDVKVLQSLGHGLDEAALAAAKSARFEAAVRCGKPSSSTFTISMRFSAS